MDLCNGGSSEGGFWRYNFRLCYVYFLAHGKADIRITDRESNPVSDSTGMRKP
jgi:hypothetical protein